jgi:hypothetical protein
MAKLVIGTHTFTTKAAAEAHIRSILLRGAPPDARGESIHYIPEGEDEQFVRALISMHPRKTIIEDCGISRVGIQTIEKGYRRFVVKRIDGSIRDWSWRHALTPDTNGKKLRSVLRHLIEPQIIDYRHGAFLDGPRQCPFTGEVVFPETAHIDHAAPDTFESLVLSWLKLMRLDDEEIELIHRTGMGQYTVMADSWLAENWIEYHRENANLRVVSKTANLSILRKTA